VREEKPSIEGWVKLQDDKNSLTIDFSFGIC
jgi:hypothetical protein